MSGWHQLCKLEELAEDQIASFALQGNDIIAVIDKAGEPKVYRDLCSHQDVKLSDFGEITEERELICHAHAAKFCLKTGGALCQPATEPITSYPCKVVGDTLEVLLP